MTEPKFRIENKRNGTMAGTPITTFKVFERMGEVWLDRGETFALGADASDRDCVRAALLEPPRLDERPD